MTDLKVNDGFSGLKIPQSDISLSMLEVSGCGSDEVPVRCYDKHRAAFVWSHTSHVSVFVVVNGPDRSSYGVRTKVYVENDHVATVSGVDEQQSQHRGVRRHRQLQQPAVFVERQDGIAGARRNVPHVNAEAADVSVTAVTRR